MNKCDPHLKQARFSEVSVLWIEYKTLSLVVKQIKHEKYRPGTSGTADHMI